MKLSEIRAQQTGEPPKRLKLSDIRAQQPTPTAPQMPTATAVLGSPPQESREDELRRKAQEDIVAGMGTGEKLALGFDRGVTRIGQALKQTALHAFTDDNPLLRASKAILPDAGDANIDAMMKLTGMPERSRAYDRQLQRESQEWGLGAGKDIAANVGDIAGGMAVTLPLGGPAAKGGSILANAGKAALTAAPVAGLTTPVDNGAEDFAAAKARQTAVGGVVAGGASAALQGAGKLIEKAGVGNAVRGAYNWLAGKAADSAEAKAAEASAKRLGVELTPGQITGNKQQLGVESAVRQSIFQRDRVFQQDMKAADQYATAVSNQLDKLGKAGDQITAGNAVRDSINDAVDKLAQRRAKLAANDFAKVDELARGAPVIEPTNYRTVAQQIIEENSVAPKGSDARALADAASELLESSANNGKAGNALKTRRYLSQIAGGQASFAGQSGQPIQKRAAAMLLSALDQDIEAAAGKGGSLGEALKEANSRYRAYSQRIDDIRKSAVGKILGDDLGEDLARVAPEVIYKRFTELPASQVDTAMKKLLSPQAQEQVKRAYVQKALESAQMPTAAGGAVQANVRPLTFVRALQRDGNTADRAKLKAIFNDAELGELDELMSIGRRLGDRTGANTSETAVMAQTQGVISGLKDGLLKWGVSIGGQALGAREIARIMADSGGRKAVLKLRALPKGSAEARDLAAYLSGLAAAKETDD